MSHLRIVFVVFFLCGCVTQNSNSALHSPSIADFVFANLGTGEIITECRQPNIPSLKIAETVCYKTAKKNGVFSHRLLAGFDSELEKEGWEEMSQVRGNAGFYAQHLPYDIELRDVIFLKSSQWKVDKGICWFDLVVFIDYVKTDEVVFSFNKYNPCETLAI